MRIFGWHVCFDSNMSSPCVFFSQKPKTRSSSVGNLFLLVFFCGTNKQGIRKETVSYLAALQLIWDSRQNQEQEIWPKPQGVSAQKVGTGPHGQTPQHQLSKAASLSLHVFQQRYSWWNLLSVFLWPCWKWVKLLASEDSAWDPTLGRILAVSTKKRVDK